MSKVLFKYVYGVPQNVCSRIFINYDDSILLEFPTSTKTGLCKMDNKKAVIKVPKHPEYLINHIVKYDDNFDRYQIICTIQDENGDAVSPRECTIIGSLITY